jgi:endonuclease/exonuclease/phosphatase family metal-dependent hydrolase
MTWNVDSLSPQFHKRYKTITSIIKKEDPDIITLQETSVMFYPELKKSKYREYYQSDSCGALTTLSKYPITWQKCYLQHTAQLRPILITDILVNHSIVRVINVHLDSYTFSEYLRIQQIKFINTKIDIKNVIFGGDFNFNDYGNEMNFIDTRFIDAWKYSNPLMRDFTWDITNNSLALKNSYDGEYSERIDRILLKGPFNIIKTYMIGKQPITEDLFPSDHFGIITQVEI